ncbi:hypothetical protein HK102_010709, partial [Quaeritorhiza haematococci]
NLQMFRDPPKEWIRILEDEYPLDDPGLLRPARCVRFRDSGKVAGVIVLRRVADVICEDKTIEKAHHDLNPITTTGTVDPSSATKLVRIFFRTLKSRLSIATAYGTALESSYYLGPVYASPNLTKWEHLLFLAAVGHFFDSFEAHHRVTTYTVAVHPTIESMAKAYGGTIVQTVCFDDEEDWILENEEERKLWVSAMGRYDGMRTIDMYRFVR